MDARESREDNGREVWRWCDIMEQGSEELREIIAIITHGRRPGIPYKESEKDE